MKKEITKKAFVLLDRPGKTIPQNVIDSMLNTYEEPDFDEGFDEIIVI